MLGCSTLAKSAGELCTWRGSWLAKRPVRDAKEKVSMDIIHPNVPETIKRLADAYEYLVERGGASIAYSLLLTSGKM